MLINFIQRAVDQILISEIFESNSKITTDKGCCIGDGFTSKTVAITVSDKVKVLHLFIKYYPYIVTVQNPWAKVFNTEIHFYEKIYPAFQQFQDIRGIKNPFVNIPRYYSTKTDNCVEPVVLENLRINGYTLLDRKNQFDDDHIILVLKSLAKLHGVSFALKNQDPGLFKQLQNNGVDVLSTHSEQISFENMMQNLIERFMENLDPVCDQIYLENKSKLAKELLSFSAKVKHLTDDYGVFMHGDCWTNNIMFAHEPDSTKPINLKFIDWQNVSVNSPVLDVSHFFYPVATKGMMDDIELYKNIYYNALSEHISNLGSEPNILYPYHVFQSHWRTYSKFGLLMSFACVKSMLTDNDEILDISEDMKNGEIPMEVFPENMRNNGIYQERMKIIFGHFLNNNLLQC